MDSSTLHPAAVECKGSQRQDVTLHGFSYEERRLVLPMVAEVVGSRGCWLKERHATSFSQVEFVFEMQLRSALDIYSGLIGTGLELIPASHSKLTSLCTVRRHDDGLRQGRQRLLSLRLEVSFLEDLECEMWLASGGLA
jgi:hypothetical protein